MKITASQTLLKGLIENINRHHNTNYNIDDITNIEFILHYIYIWMNDGSKFYIMYNIYYMQYLNRNKRNIRKKNN